MDPHAMSAMDDNSSIVDLGEGGISPSKRGFADGLRATVPSAAAARGRPTTAPVGRGGQDGPNHDDPMKKLSMSPSPLHRGASTANLRQQKQPSSRMLSPLQRQATMARGGAGKKVSPSRRKQLHQQQQETTQSPNRRRSMENGVKYVYDIHGRFVPEDKEYEATALLRERRETLARTVSLKEDLVVETPWMGVGKVFDPEGSLVQKTREWSAEHFSKYTDEVNHREKSFWRPMTVPSTTFAVDPGDTVLPHHAIKQWPEYALMESDDVIVTIEHCSECDKHDSLCHHDEERYRNVAEALRAACVEVLKLFAVRYAVIVKPHKPTHTNPFSPGGPLAGSLQKGRNPVDDQWQLIPGFPNPTYTQSNAHEHKVMGIDYSHRMGAMEVQVAVHPGSGWDILKHILFSKILHGVWPEPPAVAQLLFKLLKSVRLLQVVDELPPLLARRSPRKGRSPKKADINVNKPPPKAREPVVVPWANEGQGAKIPGRGERSLSMRMFGQHRSEIKGAGGDDDDATSTSSAVGSAAAESPAPAPRRPSGILKSSLGSAASSSESLTTLASEGPPSPTKTVRIADDATAAADVRESRQTTAAAAPAAALAVDVTSAAGAEAPAEAPPAGAADVVAEPASPVDVIPPPTEATPPEAEGADVSAG